MCPPYSQAGTAYGEDPVDTIIEGDALIRLRELPDRSVQTCVTSPPYFGLRDYGVPEQIGLEDTPDEFVQKLVLVFREVRRVLRNDGTLWLNLGDSYAGSWGAQGHAGAMSGRAVSSARQVAAMPHKKSHAGTIRPKGLKPKDLIGIPWRVAFALQADGWYLRQDIIWSKPNPMPESVTDRCTKAHDYNFLLSKPVGTITMLRQSRSQSPNRVFPDFHKISRTKPAATEYPEKKTGL